MAMKAFQQLQKWQTAIQIQPQPAQVRLLRPTLTQIPIRRLHALTGGGAAEVAEVKVVEVAERAEVAEEGIKIRVVREGLGRITRTGKRVGGKWAGRTISEYIFLPRGSQTN
jgi:hypothetical protein